MKSKKKKILLTCTVLLIVGVACILTAIAHKGRTDSNGGHRDNQNESGLGGYHYHCDGYPAHLHTNGCPYQPSNTTPSSTTPTESNFGGYSDEYGEEYDYGYEDGYDQGFENGRSEGHHEGYVEGTKEYEGKYDEGYKCGYEKGYEEGYDARLSEVKAEKQKGLREFMVLLGAIILIVLIVKFIKKIKASKTK